MRRKIMKKGSRHSNIIGKFGEQIICNWLSRSGFEVAIVDQVGLDIIAYKKDTGKLGISVKSRMRKPGKETTSVYVFRNEKDDKNKLIKTCKEFGCKPWIAIYVETEKEADIYLTSVKNYEKYLKRKKRIDDWKMSDDEYIDDPLVKHIKIMFHKIRWW